MPELSIDRYAVLGNPIAHSKSPIIHSMFAEQTGENIVYEKQLVELGQFESSAQTFFQSGGKGLNVTVPFKEDAFRFSDKLSKAAKLAGAINTLTYRNGNVVGDNTDGAGLVWDLKENNAIKIADSTILVIGAGGATRGALFPLLQEMPKEIVIVNRTVSKAHALANLFKDYGLVTAGSIEEAHSLSTYDMVINATSASISGKVPSISSDTFKSDPFTYDMFYGAQLTPFLSFAKQSSVTRFADGLGMLVGQAAESFAIWRGCRPNASLVLTSLRSGM